jgi:hypothetical protein
MDCLASFGKINNEDLWTERVGCGTTVGLADKILSIGRAFEIRFILEETCEIKTIA